MKRFLTSDPHYGHVNIIQYTSRPYYSVGEMNADMVRRWNEVVASEDKVYVLGDVCMGRVEASLDYVRQLNGTKYLLPGNHDRMFGAAEEKRARWTALYLKAGFAAILGAEREFTLPGIDERVLACHFPYRGDSREDKADRYKEYRPKDTGQWLVHGHSHGLWRKKDTMIDVGVDAWGGYPVSFEQVATLFLEGPAEVEPLVWEPA